MNCWRRNSRCSVRSSDTESEEVWESSKERVSDGEGCLGVWMSERCPRVERGVRRRIRNSVLKIESQLDVSCLTLVASGSCSFVPHKYVDFGLEL